MRLDHIAYRVKDRHKTVNFFLKAFDYRIQTEFDLEFADGSKVKCFALEPPEKPKFETCPWDINSWVEVEKNVNDPGEAYVNFHMAPEIFVSDGDEGSIVGQWVAKRDNIGGIHHIAYQVESVQQTMDEWRDKGYAEFCTDKPLTCPGLVQVFTKPSELTGVIYEFIERGTQGFCKDNVKSLMLSTNNLS